MCCKREQLGRLNLLLSTAGHAADSLIVKDHGMFICSACCMRGQRTLLVAFPDQYHRVSWHASVIPSSTPNTVTANVPGQTINPVDEFIVYPRQ